MRDFFRGRRRKIGLLTLLMACMFAAGWVRSFVRGDGAYSAMGQLISHHGGLFCEIIPSLFEFRLSCFSTDAESMRNPYSHPSLTDIWDWKRLGFAFGAQEGDIKNADGTTSRVTVYRFYIPYLSIVVPLFLISMWLLLDRPGSAKKTVGAERQ